jgi:hypothetical protein
MAGGRKVTGSNDMARRGSGSTAYRAAVALAVVTSLLTVWTTIVRDDGNGMGFFMVIMAAAVGGFAASFRPAGLARAMAGVAVMHATVGLLIATAPVTASVPGQSVKALAFSGVFAALWLASAGLFRTAARGDRQAAS